MKKVLICSDSFKRISGLSYVALNLVKFFVQKNYDVRYCVITGENSTIEDLRNKGHFFYEHLYESKIYNCQNKRDGSIDLYNDCIKEFKPNIVVSIHDLWQFENIALSPYKDTYTSIKYYTDNLIAYRKEGNDNDIYYFQGNKYIMNEDHDKNLFLFRYEACNGLYFYNFNKNTDLYEALEFHIKHILNINIGSLLVRQNYITDEYIDNDFRDGKFTRI